MPAERSPFLRVPCIAAAITTGSHVLSAGLSTSSTVLLPALSLLFEWHVFPVSTGIYEREKVWLINKFLLFEVSAETHYMLGSVQARSFFEKANDDSPMRERHWACSVLDHRAPETGRNLAGISLGLRDQSGRSVRYKNATQSPSRRKQKSLKKDVDETTVLYGDHDSSKK